MGRTFIATLHVAYKSPEDSRTEVIEPSFKHWTSLILYVATPPPARV